MKRKVYKLIFTAADGSKVEPLCKDDASPQEIIAALQFLSDGFSIEVSCTEVELPSVALNPAAFKS